MSRERARRRAEVAAQAAARRAAQERSARRRRRRQAVLDRVTLGQRRRGSVSSGQRRRGGAVFGRRRHTGTLLPRRSRGQRLAIAGCGLAALIGIWWTFSDLELRIALSALVLVAMPAMIVLTLDRR